ncbi:MAG: hypothetical protein OXC66_02045 [Roseovarius sp.]|nr:hypothetical protein [Roseovarius sp.]
MSVILDDIRGRIGAENCCKSCSRDGCKVSLNKIPRNRVVVDADKAFEAHDCHGKRCDFILFALNGVGKLVAAPIELKSGGVNLSTVLEQLQIGAAFIEKFTPKGIGAICRPVLIHGGRIRSQDRRILNRGSIRFGGVGVKIKTTRCNRPGNLADALGISKA